MGIIHVTDGAEPESKNLFWQRHLDTSSVRLFSSDFLLAVLTRTFVHHNLLPDGCFS